VPVKAQVRAILPVFCGISGLTNTISIDPLPAIVAAQLKNAEYQRIKY
jgi:hypothetical protein